LPTSTSSAIVPEHVTHEGVSSNLQALPDGRLLYIRQTTENPGDVFVLENLPNVSRAQERQVTHFSQEKLKRVEMPEESEFWFKGAEGRHVHGMIVKPVGWAPAANKNQSWPVVLYIHGGAP
jgi:dipeptidyl aminopeptidase/acylaminoacyl peptidase